jgi:hypothetical protein
MLNDAAGSKQKHCCTAALLHCCTAAGAAAAAAAMALLLVLLQGFVPVSKDWDTLLTPTWSFVCVMLRKGSTKIRQAKIDPTCCPVQRVNVRPNADWLDISEQVHDAGRSSCQKKLAAAVRSCTATTLLLGQPVGWQTGPALTCNANGKQVPQDSVSDTASSFQQTGWSSLAGQHPPIRFPTVDPATALAHLTTARQGPSLMAETC